MKRFLSVVLAIVLLAALGVVVVRFIVERISPRPGNLGVSDGKLAPCPPTPNCVSSQAGDDKHGMVPIPYEGDTATAKSRLLDIIDVMPRTTIITDEPTYVYVEFRTVGFNFVDDVEFTFDEEENVIHFRSASRIGRSDFGVNGNRMEEIREKFLHAS